MSPLGDGIRESNSNSENDFKYPTKVRQLRALLSTLVPGVQIVMKGYQRLNYAIPAEREQENTNERGIALFQYDPNSDGNGQRAYRLFYQQTVYEQNV